MSGSVPPPIGGPGASGSVPPVSTLPAPTDAQSKIQKLISRFGMKSIAGSGATLDNLNRLEEAYARLPSDSFKNLSKAVFDLCFWV